MGWSNELKASSNDWKIVVFHHPLYSSGERHGSDLRLREVLEPLFLKYNVSVVLNGHDHFYERVKPQKGIQYFVVGSGGQLRAGNIDRQSGLTAKGFDTDLAFMAAEITGDQMYFNAIARTGQTVDSGVLTRRKISALSFAKEAGCRDDGRGCEWVARASGFAETWAQDSPLLAAGSSEHQEQPTLLGWLEARGAKLLTGRFSVIVARSRSGLKKGF